MRLYRFVGPPEIGDRVRGEAGYLIRSQTDLANWLHRHPEAITEAATFVVDQVGLLRLAPRRSEHVDCAAGGQVYAAGEMRFSPEHALAEVTNQSTGYCPEPSCWPAVALALTDAGIAAPSGFTSSFIFRRCTVCGTTNLVKEAWFVCGACDADLPAAWNFDDD